MQGYSEVMALLEVNATIVVMRVILESEWEVNMVCSVMWCDC